MATITEVIRNSSAGNTFTLALEHGGISLADADLYPTWASDITAVELDLYGADTITNTTNPSAFDFTTTPGSIIFTLAGIYADDTSGYSIVKVTSGGVVYQFTDRDNSCLKDLPELFLCIRA